MREVSAEGGKRRSQRAVNWSPTWGGGMGNLSESLSEVN